MGLNWQPISSLGDRWRTNLVALRQRDESLAAAVESHTPTSDFVVLCEDRKIQLGIRRAEGIANLASTVTQPGARDIVKQVFPAGRCAEPLMIAGLDHGWLWSAAYALDCETPVTPGHRPPLYFLTSEIHRLWVAMHLQDWSQLLADQRVRLFVGENAVQQCLQNMTENTQIPWAKLCVTIEPGLWPIGVTVDSLWQTAHQSANTRMQQMSRQIETIYAGFDVKSIIRRLRGERLRVMGITSNYTTFLKYSMRDWLDAFSRMGHDTHLIIENTTHELANPLSFGRAVIDFKPDLLLMIDHYRGEITGLPRQIPCVMWVQDHLPNIFKPEAGAAQGPRDYCVGFGRLHLRDQYNYPEQRFLPAQVCVNEARFAPREIATSDQEQYGCDVSFVSHASMPATALLGEEIRRADEMGRKLLLDIFERMRAIYDAGKMITHASLINQMIDQSLTHLRFQIDAPSRRGIFDFFSNRINNALFRHQTLTWAADLGVNLHLWGRGWDQHPRFSRFAKGIAGNDSQLCTIYQASKINLQATPFGAVHQRLLDGLAAGGFFLVRYTGGDCVEPIYRQINEWRVAKHIEDDETLRQSAPPEIHRLFEQVKSLLGVGPFDLGASFVDVLRLSADGGYIRSAASVWPEYWQVSFDSAELLHRRAEHFLKYDDQRAQIASTMRQAVIDKLSYTTTSRRLLDFMADDLQRNQLRQELAA